MNEHQVHRIITRIHKFGAYLVLCPFDSTIFMQVLYYYYMRVHVFDVQQKAGLILKTIASNSLHSSGYFVSMHLDGKE